MPTTNCSSKENLENNLVSSSLTISLHSKIPALSKDVWDSLFSGSSNAYDPLLRLSEGSEIRKTYILIVQNQVPVLLLPIYSTDYQLRQSADRKEKILVRLVQLFSAKKKMSIALLGLKTGQYGCNFDIGPDVVEVAWHLVLETLEQFAVQSGIALICFSEFDLGQKQLLKAQPFKNYISIRKDFSSIEERPGKKENSTLFFAATTSLWRWLPPVLGEHLLRLMQIQDEAQALATRNIIR